METKAGIEILGRVFFLNFFWGPYLPFLFGFFGPKRQFEKNLGMPTAYTEASEAPDPGCAPNLMAVMDPERNLTKKKHKNPKS